MRHKNVQIAGHQGFVLRLGPAGKIDIIQSLAHGLRVLAVVNRVKVRERCLLHQLIGARAIETDPVVLPRVGLVGSVGDKLVGFGQKQIARLQSVRCTIDLVDALARHNQVDQVVVAHTGAPRVARQAGLMPAVKNRELNIVRVALLVGLFHLIDGHGCTSLA